jgi:hypothetical protein
MRILLLAGFIGLAGCAVHSQDRNEQVEIYQRQEPECNKAGGQMVIKRTGTRIRRAITLHELKTAACRKNIAR